LGQLPATRGTGMAKRGSPASQNKEKESRKTG
jgi:hypothetical protein